MNYIFITYWGPVLVISTMIYAFGSLLINKMITLIYLTIDDGIFLFNFYLCLLYLSILHEQLKNILWFSSSSVSSETSKWFS